MILDFAPHDAVSEPFRREIRDRLAAVCREEGATPLLAVESGSRAWGFHSPDSDYDCRFLYVRPVDAYLALRPVRDVIERPIVDEIDLGGWDIGKALRLMARGNAIVAEWMTSPIVYDEAPGFRDGFMPLVQAWRALHGDVAHYYGLARRQWAGFIENRTEVKLKKYFYVIRPAVALHWLRIRDDAPPMNLPALLEGVSLPADTANALAALRRAKQAAGEGAGVGPRIDALDTYIAEQMDWGRQARAAPPRAETDVLWTRSQAFFTALVRSEG
ncbi:MAG TPA: nucleotidyltransferase domain-containing protein [Caulobacter sp.]|nr:nucleotidyltransferase domain-containing protein [Caulobacter sp.]